MQELNNPEMELNDEEISNSDDGIIETKDEEAAEEELFYDIEGEEVTLETIIGWKKGQMMQSDYTKGKQSIASERTQLNADKEKLSASIDELTALESGLEELLSTDSEIDMDALRETDVSEYLRLQEKQARKTKKLAVLREQLKSMKGSLLEENYKVLVESLGWSNEETKTSDLKEIREYVSASNITDKEFKDVSSPGVVQAILLAAKYKKLMSDDKLKKKRAPSLKAVKPTTGKEPQKLSLAERMYGKK